MTKQQQQHPFPYHLQFYQYNDEYIVTNLSGCFLLFKFLRSLLMLLFTVNIIIVVKALLLLVILYYK